MSPIALGINKMKRGDRIYRLFFIFSSDSQLKGVNNKE